jgi:serine/threonine-protein kinase
VNLLVSLGAVPDVTGKSVDDATAALRAVHLAPEKAAQSYSDTVPDGDVISAAPAKDGAVHTGDTILLTVSKGPAPVPVTNVSGKTISAAKAALEADGFTVKVDTNVPNALWGVILIQSTNPAGGASVKKGSAVTIVAQY